jgi:hypothetical protein
VDVLQRGRPITAKPFATLHSSVNQARGFAAAAGVLRVGDQGAVEFDAVVLAQHRVAWFFLGVDAGFEGGHVYIGDGAGQAAQRDGLFNGGAGGTCKARRNCAASLA